MTLLNNMNREQYIINNIKTALESVDEIAQVIPRPLGENEKITKYPCAIFYPSSSENSFHSVKDNEKTYRYELHLVVGLKNDTADNVFLTVFPTLVDAVEDNIDGGWDMGTLNGARIWKWLDSGTAGLSLEGNEAYRTFDIRIRLLKEV